MTHRSISTLTAILLVAAVASCGDGDPLGPTFDEAQESESSRLTSDGLGIGWPSASEPCPSRPQEQVFGAYDVQLMTVPIYDPTRDIDVKVDVMVPIDPSTHPLVFGGGPYAVVVFSNGALPYDPTEYTVDFEPMFPEFTYYWASRGHIVLAPRHHHFPDKPVKNQDWRVRDVTYALDNVRELVRAVDPYAFVDLRNPIVAGFSSGTTTAAMILGTTHLDGDLRGKDYRDPRFKGGILLSGYTGYFIGHDLRSNFSRLTMPLLSIVGANDIANEPPNVPEDFLDIVRDSPPGGKHGVLVNGAGHWLGARPWRGDAPGTLEVSQKATTLFLRSYGRRPNGPAIATLSDNNFCGLVSNSAVEVERHEPKPPVSLDQDPDPVPVPRRSDPPRPRP